MQGLGGLLPGLSRGATMSGNKSAVGASFTSAIAFGQTSWTAPYSGYFRFTLRGGGGNATASLGGGSGAAAQASCYLQKGASIACTVGNGGAAGSVDGGDTTLTLPNGVVVTAGGGKSASNGGAGGVAIGGEASTPGLPSVSTTGGNAPDFGTFPGAPTNTVSGRQPGTGAGGSYISTIVNGGTGEIYVTGL